MLPAATTMAAAAAVLIAAASTASSSTMGVEAAISPFGVVGVPSVTRRAAWGGVESISRGGSTGEEIKIHHQCWRHMMRRFLQRTKSKKEKPPSALIEINDCKSSAFFLL